VTIAKSSAVFWCTAVNPILEGKAVSYTRGKCARDNHEEEKHLQAEIHRRQYDYRPMTVGLAKAGHTRES